MKRNKLLFHLKTIVDAFELHRPDQCPFLDEWINVRYELSELDRQILEKVYQEIKGNTNYWNEEELKMKLVSLLFFVANIDVRHQIQVFYERPLAASLRGYDLFLFSDCMVASSDDFNFPQTPYFFSSGIQEKTRAIR